MPEVKTVQSQVEAYQQQFITTLQGLDKEFQTKLADYNAKKATMTDAARTVAESDLQDLQKRSNDVQTKASQQVEAKGQELMRPLYDKVKAAVAAIAKEKGYTYVINATTNDLLLVAPPADDLFAAVKLKLNLK
jgi:outer membrane protein